MLASARAAAQRLANRHRVADQPCGRCGIELVSALRLGLIDVGVEDAAARFAVAGVHGSLGGIELGQQAALDAARQSVVERFTAAGVPEERISCERDTYTFNSPVRPRN